MKFEEKYLAAGLNTANASWAGPGWRRAFKADAGTPMEANKTYAVGILPSGFDLRKARLAVSKAAAAGTTLSITLNATLGGTPTWTAVTAASLAAVAATYYSTTPPGPLTMDTYVCITANKAVDAAEFAVEIVGDVFGAV